MRFNDEARSYHYEYCHVYEQCTSSFVHGFSRATPQHLRAPYSAIQLSYSSLVLADHRAPDENDPACIA